MATKGRGQHTLTAAGVHRQLAALADPVRAAGGQRYFKTGPGEYGEGDRFHGVAVPVLRMVLREAWTMPRGEVKKLLRSPWHEERLLAVLILVRQYEKGTNPDRDAIFRLYLDSLEHINNWDIVDSSAPGVVGAHLGGRGRATLLKLARSKHLWSRRVAVLATHHTIRRGEFDDTLTLARLLLKDPDDLIHKATGWMLREVGQVDRKALETFLDAHAGQMPRTMLRYATEKLPELRRRHYLARPRR